MAQYRPTDGVFIDGYAHLNGVLLAGILTDFYRDYHRNYNWGAGFSIKAGLNVSLFQNKLTVNIASQFYNIFTWNGYDPDFDWSTSPDGHPINIQGDSSKAFFNHFEITLKYRLWNHLYLTAGIDRYHRQTNYDGITIKFENAWTRTPILESTQLGAHIMLTYAL